MTTDTQQPEAPDWINFFSSPFFYREMSEEEAAGVAEMLRRQHARIRELEAELRGRDADIAILQEKTGYQPSFGWHAFPAHLENPDARTLRTASHLLKRHGYDHLAVTLRKWSDELLVAPYKSNQDEK